MARLDDFYTRPYYVDTTWDYGDLGVGTTQGAGLDFTLLTNGVPVWLPIDMYAYLGRRLTAGASDAKTFDSRNSMITHVDLFNTTTYQPSISVPYGEGRDINYDYIDCSVCGKIYDDASTITPVDNTETIDITVPNHGIPTDTEGTGGRLSLSAGAYGESGVLSTWRVITIDDIIDENTIRLSASLANWNSWVGAATPQNLYITRPILRRGGGVNFSSFTLRVHWRFDVNHPTFTDSVFSDD